MALLRGKGHGLEIVFADRDFDDALSELERRLSERAGFYRGSNATAAFGGTLPSPEQVAALQSALKSAGVMLAAICGEAGCEAVAAASGLEFVPIPTAAPEPAQRRAFRPKRHIRLSEAATSLAADFAGARQDLAARRIRGPVAPAPATLKLVEPGSAEAGSSTLYHVGTLRGGQSLQKIGHIVVIGDLNPGAELVASGDIVVFGSLRGVAHAGAQGDCTAKVYALDLAPTQLRIATFIAADSGSRKKSSGPQAAYVQNERITIAPHDKINLPSREGVN